MVLYLSFAIIFIIVSQNFVNAKALFCFNFVLIFDNRIVSNFAEHNTAFAGPYFPSFIHTCAIKGGPTLRRDVKIP